MKAAHILIAEDDDNIREGLVDTLESEGYKVTAAADGQEALKAFSRQKCDLIILDVMMPQMSGYDVCREIRALDKSLPVIMLTAKGEEIDKVVGLQLGADDYVTKPFGVHELLARIAAALRRSRVNNESRQKNKKKMPDNFTFGPAKIDTRQLSAARGKKTFKISAKELKLIRYFHERPNEAVGRDELLDAVWGVDYYGTTRTLDQHIAQLRKKIETDPGNPAVIVTVHGVGYKYKKH